MVPLAGWGRVENANLRLNFQKKAASGRPRQNFSPPPMLRPGVQTVADCAGPQRLEKFFDFTAKLAKACDKSSVAELREKLPPPREIMHQDWLLERMEELGN